MDAEPTLPLTLVLAPGQHLHWHSPGGARVRVLAGRAWLTGPGDPDDHFLAAGDSRPLRPGSLIGAEGELRIRLEAIAPARDKPGRPTAVVTAAAAGRAARLATMGAGRMA